MLLLKIALVALLFGPLSSFVDNVFYDPSVAQKQIQDAVSSSKNDRKGLPARLKIPKLNVDAAIEYVGLTPEGAMEVPKNTTNVGWFNLGPRPGEKGSAVIAGHFNGENGEAGVFANLYKLKAKDKLYVEDDRGTLTTFSVRESHTYNPGYAEEVFSLNDSVYLNLITCDGVWDGVIKSYSKRLVIFTDIIAQN